MKKKTIFPGTPTFKRKKKIKRERKLTLKQTRFAHEYVIDGNGTAAAIRAGYKAAGAHVTAHVLLNTNKIQDLIQELQDKIHTKLQITAERTLLEVARLAYFDPRKLYDAAGNLIPIHKLDDDTAACVAGIDIIESKDPQTNAITKKYKVWDKNSALEKMIKRFSKTFEGGDGEDAPVSKKIFFQTIDASKRPEA